MSLPSMPPMNKVHFSHFPSLPNLPISSYLPYPFPHHSSTPCPYSPMPSTLTTHQSHPLLISIISFTCMEPHAHGHSNHPPCLLNLSPHVVHPPPAHFHHFHVHEAPCMWPPPFHTEEFEEKYEEFEDKIWRNTSIHSVIPSFTMNESINK